MKYGVNIVFFWMKSSILSFLIFFFFEGMHYAAGNCQHKMGDKMMQPCTDILRQCCLTVK